MFRTMLLARKIDERMWLLNRAGKIPFVISCQGQEAAQVEQHLLLIERKIMHYHTTVIWVLY